MSSTTVTMPIAAPAVDVICEIEAAGSGAFQVPSLTMPTIHAAPATRIRSMATRPTSARVDFFIGPLSRVRPGVDGIRRPAAFPGQPHGEQARAPEGEEDHADDQPACPAPGQLAEAPDEADAARLVRRGEDAD